MELTDKIGADAVIDFVNGSKTVETDMQILRRRAKVVFVGLFGGELKLSLVTMPTRAYRIIGSYTGGLNDLDELVSLAKRKIIKPVVSDKFKLDQATEALTKLKGWQNHGKRSDNSLTQQDQEQEEIQRVKSGKTVKYEKSRK